ncbi:MAG: hypothetical protein ABJF04_09550 [Reichenbachiella sp.]|uniref:YciI family protein n=1 Tax=Reichenbachiella sp. TaxID=2184521 RepID=UPI003264E9F8
MEDKLTKEEQALFDSLSRETLPPSSLEDRIIAELKKKKLINENVMKTNKTKLWMTGVAASILFFIGGYFVGNTGSDGSSEISSGYILLLHEDERFSPEGSDMEIFTEYASWMGKMMMNGVSITGKELSPESTTWLSPESEAVVDIGKDKISGYFIIDVEDRQEAEKIAMSSPHIKYGGRVELIKLSDRN